MTPSLVETVELVPVWNGVGELEAFQKSGFQCDSRVPSLKLHPDVAKEWEWEKKGNAYRDTSRHLTITRVWGFVSPQSVCGILGATRKRLLDFLIELMKQYPALEDDDDAIRSLPREQVFRVFERTVNHFHKCNLAGGDQTLATNTIHAEGSITVGGHFVMADAIENAFNSVGAAPPAMKEFLQKLADMGKATTQSLTEDKQRQFAEDYRQLAEQANKPEPNKRWVRTALEGIAEVAVTLGAVGKPLLDLLGQARQLFGL